jgi:hypothetical protein
MYAPTPQPSSGPLPPRLSAGARLVNVFIAPRKTFEDVRVNSSWWVPWLVGVIVSFIFGAIAAQKIDMVEFARHQVEQSKFAQRQLEQLPPEQREKQIQLRANITKYTFYIVPFFTILFGVIVGAVLMAVFNFGFAAEVTFSEALAIVFYAYLPRALFALLLGGSLLVASDPNSVDIAGNPMPTNPAFFMDPQGNKFLYSLLGYVDIFALWSTILMGLGFAVVSRNRKLTPSTGITTMLVVYGVLALIGSFFKAAF